MPASCQADQVEITHRNLKLTTTVAALCATVNLTGFGIQYHPESQPPGPTNA